MGGLELIFIVSFFILYETATPAIIIREYLMKKIKFIKPVIECMPCSSFYLTPVLIIIYKFLPIILIYTIIITAIMMIINLILDRL